MSLFYAVVKETAAIRCYLVCFASRSVADEWWRAVSPRTVEMKRITPQFYAYAGNDSLSSFMTPNPWLEPDPIRESIFHGMIVKRLDDQSKLPTLPILKFTDHISGNLFSIRLKADPTRSWFLDVDGVVKTKRDAHPNLFRVSVSNSNARNLVMIDSDTIVIVCAESSRTVRIVNGNRLGSGSGSQDRSTLTFGDFKKRFRLGAEGNGEREVTVTKDGSGDEWELV
ncbi:hypothetical protein FA95DRAFT_1193653 [Auriscalpium vulgare]|uniref:Uncharacterized protein n=1 Tax=Auriscalpium vulgare TaxID=40419 RepID=A0ACB8R3D9_9AGAM|nr:hypothetical protein FA95DRAFT_1193653 [Auriscalpium vulgare]